MSVPSTSWPLRSDYNVAVAAEPNGVERSNGCGERPAHRAEWRVESAPVKIQYQSSIDREYSMPRASSIKALHFFVIVAASALAGCSKTADAPQPDAGANVPPAAQSAPAAKEMNAKEFMVGELVAMSLRDGGIELPNDNQVFGVGRTPEEVAALMGAAGQPADKLQLDIQPLLVRRLDRVFLFVTGAGSNFGPGAGKLAASLAEA